MRYSNIITMIFGILLLSTFGFALSVSLSFSDSSMGVGDSTTLTATVSGTDTGVTAELSGTGITSEALTTSPVAVSGISTQSLGSISDTTTTSWIIQGNAVGTYSLLVTISGDSASTTGTTTLVVNNPANIILDDYSCNSGDSNLSSGNTYTVSYTLRNSGEESATITSTPTLTYFSVYSRSNADTSNQTTITGGETKSIAFTFTPSFGTTTRTGAISLALTGANDPDDISCGSVTLYVAPSTGGTTGTNDDGDTDGGVVSDDEDEEEEDDGVVTTTTTTKTITTDKFTLVLPENVSAGETKELKIIDLNGLPLKDVNIQITDPKGEITYNLTDANGLLDYEFLYDGNYAIKVYYGGKTYNYTITVKPITAGTEDTNVGTTGTTEGKSTWWIWVIVVVGIIAVIVVADLLHTYYGNKPKKGGLARLK
ncbi:MAG: hypothetical protein PHH82_02945 [Candidatus ainarchaeum sp.]|nr:hypothetical protein [Candidatus ainarchaeum sp.]